MEAFKDITRSIRAMASAQYQKPKNRKDVQMINAISQFPQKDI